MDSLILSSLIGMGGTIFAGLGGTVLGWTLHIRSLRGLLFANLHSYYETLYNKDKKKGCLCEKWEDVGLYQLDITVDFKNDSNIVATIRNPRIVFMNNDKYLFSIEPEALKSKKHFGIININPKMADRYELRAEIYNDDPEFTKLHKCTDIFLSCDNCKGEIHKIPLIKKNFAEYFETEKEFIKELRIHDRYY